MRFSFRHLLATKPVKFLRAAICSAAVALALPTTLLAQTEAAVEAGSGAVLRGLDKISASTQDLRLVVGETVRLGYLQVTLEECRYPVGNPAGDAFARISIQGRDGEGLLFTGWMIASSPALNAFDHPRFDLWVLRCST
ncbi:hypothetical protein SAMN05421688_0594 [Poseidonocella pacifica]|uniref:DUF2155 domain-containing protein n=1 Tax=Poseidonocella pacifica TaxID=871651 RepID=A0A1I0VGM6_9RHOB|nr:DUF2155 domain-containing protein [Poseidonocella pacifica]SFA75173.1 hypothetical protein SAMN05421688_0594 [Poseidonocella pacifica]